MTTINGNSGKKQRNYTKKDAKKIKSDNFTRSIREKSNIDIAILEKWMVRYEHNYFVFWGPIIFSPTVVASEAKSLL